MTLKRTTIGVLFGRETWTLRKVAQKYFETLEKWCLENDVEDQLDRSCEKSSIAESQRGKKHPTYDK